MYKKYIVAALMVLIVVSGTFGVTLSSQNFEYCIDHRGQYPTLQTQDNQTLGLIPADRPVQIFINCVGGFANANGAGITALATVFLAFVTAGLVWIARQQYTTSRAQLRAYVFVETVGLFDGPTAQGAAVPAPSGCPFHRMSIKNYGATPAYELRHWSGLQICPTGQDGAFSVPTDISDVLHASVGPGGSIITMISLGRVLTPADITAIMRGGNSIIIYGKITYKDTFGIEHETNYRMYYSNALYPPPPNHRLLFMATGNTAT